MSTEDRSARVPLAFLPPGTEARIDSLDEAIDAAQREQMFSYGLAHGRPIAVLRQHPMTLVMVEHVELALEASISRHVWVVRDATDDTLPQTTRNPHEA